jgi:hypothetical protein
MIGHHQGLMIALKENTTRCKTGCLETIVSPVINCYAYGEPFVAHTFPPGYTSIKYPEI